jgi:hypothetical protein
MDKLDSGGAVQEAFFATHLEAYLQCDLGRLKSLIILKMEAICSSDTSVVARSIWCNISKDIHRCYHSGNIPEDSILQPYTT